MRVVGSESQITTAELSEMADRMFGGFVKAVVDVKRGIVAVDAEMHADEESELLQSGSRQADLWGINLYPRAFGTEGFVEFDSLINMRPWQDNRSCYLEDERLRDEITGIVNGLVRE